MWRAGGYNSTPLDYLPRKEAPVYPALADLVGKFKVTGAIESIGWCHHQEPFARDRSYPLNRWGHVAIGGDDYRQIELVLQTVGDDVDCHADIGLLFLVRNPPVSTSMAFLIPVAEFADVNIYASCL